MELPFHSLLKARVTIMFRKFVNLLGKHFVSFKNPRVVCPPGVVPNSTGTPIIVASIMRSGTHLAIDLLLNNFPSLARMPLYVDADQLFRCGKNREQYLAGNLCIGECVIKTHYPQLIPEGKKEVILKLARESHVILLTRPIEQTYRSLDAWGIAGNFDEYTTLVNEFYAFWRSVAPHSIEVSFDELTNRDQFENVVEKISRSTGVVKKTRISFPVNPKNVRSLILTKVATRLLGRYAPTINTGIRSGMNGN